MYPTQTQRHKIIRILLILFIVNQLVNFVLGAPVDVQERLAGGIEDGTAALQNRMDVGGSTNTADQTPPSSEGTDLTLLDNDRTPPPATPATPPNRKYRFRPYTYRPNHFADTSKPVRPYFRPILALPANPSGRHPLSLSPVPEERLQPASSLATDNPLTTSHQPTPHQNPGLDLDLHPPLNPEPHPSVSGQAPIEEVAGILKNTKIKRTFPTPVQ